MRGQPWVTLIQFLSKNISLVELEEKKCGRCLQKLDSFVLNLQCILILHEVGQDKTKETLV